MTTVINIKDAPRNWKSDPQYVYIGRGGKGLSGDYGNPFPLADPSDANDRQIILRKYIKWIQLCIEDESCRIQIRELKDKILVCFCAPRLCHGDVLALVADLL